MQTPTPTVESVARLLAEKHMEIESTLAVYWAPHPEEVRLIDVATDAPTTMEVLPFRFMAFPPEVPYQTVQILMSPEEWSALESGDLRLPPGYSPRGVRLLAKRAAAG